MTAYDFEGNDWDEITESEKRAIVQRLVDSRDALADDYESLAAEHDRCPDKLAVAVEAEAHAAAQRVGTKATPNRFGHPTDVERLASIREAITAANGDWHMLTNLWSIEADLHWLLVQAEKALDEPVVPTSVPFGLDETCSCQGFPGVGYPHRSWCRREQAYAEERAEFRRTHP